MKGPLHLNLDQNNLKVPAFSPSTTLRYIENVRLSR